MRAVRPVAQARRVVYHPAASEDSMRTPPPVRTYGLTHLALAVRDPQRSLAFYRHVLGVVPVYESADFVQVQTPGSRDVIVFERGARNAGRRGGIAHFGFRLQRASDITRARRAVVAAGATIHDTGEFVPGEPYLFFKDPDGYDVEIWYEIPTPVDPKRRIQRATRRRERTS
jgi:catechol 2,3-dioxygenase-like lactoylglutathione lyase family enzyme